jgi:hypothetical protein
MYTAAFAGVTFDPSTEVPCDAIVLATGAGAPATIYEVKLSQMTVTTSEILSLKLHRGTGGSGGTGATEVPLDSGDTTTPDSTVVYKQTTQSTEANLIDAFNWNIIQEFIWLPVPELRPTILISSQFVLELETDPSVTLTMSGSIKWEEHG